MNRIRVIVAVFISALILVSVGIVLLNSGSDPVLLDQKSFYVGVTYCGDSVSEAKQLIDKVENYTNLFVLQSGSLQRAPDKINEICDYAVDSDLYFIVYFGSQHWNYRNDWLQTFDNRWDEKFLGVYFGDEPAGKMLDGTVSYWDSNTYGEIKKMADGSVSSYLADNLQITYQSNGTLLVSKYEDTGSLLRIFHTTYYPNGTIISDSNNPSLPIDNNDVTYTYEELWSIRPFQTCDETADTFVELQKSNIERGMHNNRDFATFTSDYALYWFDYLSGYDVIFAEVGWNHTLAQDIALVRGAANLQNKKWGAIITWKYNNPPYLDEGDAIYNQIRNAYEAGAEYVVIFNHPQDMSEPYGTLQEEHFVALERFWNEVVQNPEVEQGSIKGEAVLVLPKNYGWGMRSLDDKIWGLWKADENAEQIWNLRSYLIDEYGLNLDIVYEDSEFPVENKYSKIFYWNHII